MYHDRFCPQRFMSFVVLLIISVEVRQIGTNKGEVTGCKIMNTIADKTLACAFCYEHQLKLRVIMPGRRVIVVVKIFGYKRLPALPWQMFKNWFHVFKDHEFSNTSRFDVKKVPLILVFYVEWRKSIGLFDPLINRFRNKTLIHMEATRIQDFQRDGYIVLKNFFS